MPTSAATFGAGVVLLGAVVRRFGWHAGTGMLRARLHYTKWVGMSDAAAQMLSQVLALLVLQRCGQDAEAGRFAFAMQVVQVFVAVFVAFYQSLLPRARLGGVDAVPIFLRQSLRMAARLALACVALACLAALVLPMVLEELRPELHQFVPGASSDSSAFAVVMFFKLRSVWSVSTSCVRASSCSRCSGGHHT